MLSVYYTKLRPYQINFLFPVHRLHHQPGSRCGPIIFKMTATALYIRYATTFSEEMANMLLSTTIYDLCSKTLLPWTIFELLKLHSCTKIRCLKNSCRQYCGGALHLLPHFQISGTAASQLPTPVYTRV